MKVIDISAWQPDSYMDWDAVKAAGIGGVIIKIGEGKNLNETFVTHANRAVEHGIPFGVYYYARACDDVGGIEEADTVDAWIKEYLRGETPSLGIWYDAEDKRMLNGKNPVYPIAYFIDAMLKKGYTYVGLYSSYNWLTNVIDLSLLPKYVPIWVAQYGYHENSFMKENPTRVCRMWQYTDKEKIGNMSLDCSIYYK